MTSKREALVLTRRLSFTIAIAVGLAAILVLVLTAGPDQNPWRLLAELVANALLSAAVATLVFTSIAVRETTVHVDDVLDRTLRQVLIPVKRLLDDNALSGYRWDCFVVPPPKGDSLPSYAVQLFRLGYTRVDLPSELRIVCIGSMTDEVLSPYVSDERYVLRWQVESELDPADPMVFTPAEFLVDGKRLTASVHRLEKHGVRIAEYRYRLSRGGLDGIHRLEFSVRTRRWIGTDNRVPLKVLIFRTTLDSEFRCTVSDSLGFRRITAVANVSGLGPRGEEFVGAMFSNEDEQRSAVVRFGYPIQQGSSVTFTLER